MKRATTNDFDAYGVDLAWTGWFFICSSENTGVSNLKERISILKIKVVIFK